MFFVFGSAIPADVMNIVLPQNYIYVDCLLVGWKN